MQYNKPILGMGQQKDLGQFAGETWLEAIDWPASVRQASHAGSNGLRPIWIENAALLDSQCEFVWELWGSPMVSSRV